MRPVTSSLVSGVSIPERAVVCSGWATEPGIRRKVCDRETGETEVGGGVVPSTPNSIMLVLVVDTPR